MPRHLCLALNAGGAKDQFDRLGACAYASRVTTLLATGKKGKAAQTGGQNLCGGDLEIWFSRPAASFRGLGRSRLEPGLEVCPRLGIGTWQ